MTIRGLRDVPYPFTGMLAICSDIDYCTPSRFKATHRLCNTTVDTGAAGIGVGLDIGDTCFVVDAPRSAAIMEPGVVALNTIVNRWNSEADWEAQVAPTRVENGTRVNAGATFVARYMRAGWIDGLHSGFGVYANPYLYNGVQYDWQGATDGEAWKSFLTSNGLTIDQWVLHSKAQSNQTGTEPHGATIGAGTFWMDKLYESGARWVWGGDLILGGAFGGRRNLLTPVVYGGYKFWSFPRYGLSQYGNQDYTSQADTFGQILTTALLDELTTLGGLQVLYVHMGNWVTVAQDQNPTRDPIFPTETQTALRRLRTYQDDGKVLVARTSRMMRYNHARDNCVWAFDPYTGTLNIHAIRDTHTGESIVPTLDRLRGVTWYVTGNPTQCVCINGVPVNESDILRAPADATGRASVGIRWHDYDRTDYTTTTTPNLTGRIQQQSAYNLASRPTAANRRVMRGTDLKGGIR